MMIELGEAGERRKISPRERTAPASEAEHLEEHAPHDRLLERDGVQPPLRDRRRATEHRARATEREPCGDVERDLDGVDDVDRERRAVALHRPRGADHATALVERLLHPLERRIRRRRRIEEAHRSREYPPLSGTSRRRAATRRTI